MLEPQPLAPRKAVVLACSGPCLRQVDVWAPGLPVAAVSTAIRVVPGPTWWLLLDSVSHRHGDVGLRTITDPKVHKIIPASRAKGLKKAINVTWAAVLDQTRSRKRQFMDGGSPPIITVFKRSSLFAIQWLISEGYNDIVFAGCDMACTKEDPYAYTDHVGMVPKLITRQQKGHQRELAQIAAWSKIADTKGVRFLSWSPGSPINRFMEPFDEHGRFGRNPQEVDRSTA